MEKVKLNFTCPLKLTDFDHTPTGFHCGMCKKNIVDFRGKTKAEVDDYRAQHKTENTCGLFHKEQVVDVAPDFYEPSPSFFRAPLYKRVQLVMVICFATFLFSCKEDVQPQGKALTVWDKVNDLEENFSKEVLPGQMRMTKTDSIKQVVVFEPPTINGDIAEPPIEILGGIGSEPVEAKTVCTFYAEQMPEFPGGASELYRFIGANLEYPEQAIKEEVQGKMYVRFTVKKDGTAGDLQLLRGIGLESEFMKSIDKIISLMPKWKPGMQAGEPVDVYFSLPIKFKLPDVLSGETESKPITKNVQPEKRKTRDESGVIISPKKQR